MWKYYVSLLRELPGIFRETAEKWMFWIGSLVSLILLLNPELRSMTEAEGFSRWFAAIPISLLFVYGLLRANYRRFEISEKSLRELQLQIDKAPRSYLKYYPSRMGARWGIEVTNVGADDVRVWATTRPAHSSGELIPGWRERKTIVARLKSGKSDFLEIASVYFEDDDGNQTPDMTVDSTNVWKTLLHFPTNENQTDDPTFQSGYRTKGTDTWERDVVDEDIEVTIFADPQPIGGPIVQRFRFTLRGLEFRR